MLNLLMKVFRPPAVVRSFNRREEEGFNYIFNSCYYGLYYFASRLLKDKKRVDAVIDKTFISIWNSNKKWKSVAAIRRELYRTVQKLCIDYLKRHNKWDIQISKRSLMHEFIRSQVYSNIKVMLDHLPKEHHGIFRLRFILEKEWDEIENELGISRAAVVEGAAKINSILKSMASK